MEMYLRVQSSQNNTSGRRFLIDEAFLNLFLRPLSTVTFKAFAGINFSRTPKRFAKLRKFIPTKVHSLQVCMGLNNKITISQRIKNFLSFSNLKTFKKFCPSANVLGLLTLSITSFTSEESYFNTSAVLKRRV